MLDIISLAGIVIGAIGIIIALWIYYKSKAGEQFRECERLRRIVNKRERQIERLKKENTKLSKKNEELELELTEAGKVVNGFFKEHE